MLMLSLEVPALFSEHTSGPVDPLLVFLSFSELQTIKQVATDFNNQQMHIEPLFSFPASFSALQRDEEKMTLMFKSKVLLMGDKHGHLQFQRLY